MSNILEKIHKSALKFLTPLTPEQTYKLIIEEVLKLLKADFGSIFLYQEGQLKRVYTTFPFLSQVALRPEGFTYKAFKKQKAMIADIKYKKNINPKIKELGVKSDLLMPLINRGNSIGVISLLSKKSGHFTSGHLDAANLIANVATLAIRETQFYETRNFMDNILEKIHKSALKFLIPLAPEETYKLVVQEAIKLVKADHGSILIADRGKLERVYASSPIPYLIKPRKKANTYKAFTGRKPIIADISDTGKAHPVLLKYGIQSSIFIPLSYQDRSVGVLVLNSHKKERFTAKELDILKLYGSLASLAIRKTQLYSEAKKAIEDRDLFISMAAHELRTPITTISGYSQMLYSKLAGSDTAESRWITDLSWEALRLTYLVNELLEVNRIKSGQLQYTFRECSLRELVRRALADFRFTHPEHQVILQDSLASQSDLIVGDFNKLLQAVTNLLDNAAKFSATDTKIVLNLKAKSSYIILEVKDQGKGISKKDLPEIFEKFYKGTDHTEEGMGLGLFLVKNIIKRHQGDIKVRSKEGRGTIVDVKLPRVKYKKYGITA